jgi:hypothetical protein
MDQDLVIHASDHGVGNETVKAYQLVVFDWGLAQMKWKMRKEPFVSLGFHVVQEI